MIQFTEIKTRASGERVEFPCGLVEQATNRLVLRHNAAQAALDADFELPVGSQCLAYYWSHHPYNVYHLLSREGSTLGFVVNLSGPAVIGDDYVEWDDLIIDVLIVPNPTLGYRVEVQEEEKVPQDIDLSVSRYAEQALLEIMREWPSLVRELSTHSARLLAQEGR